MKTLLFFLYCFLLATAAFGVDKTYKAASGDLILDANGTVIVNKHLGVGIDPTYKLHLSGDGSGSNSVMAIEDTGNSTTFTLGVNANGGFLSSIGAYALHFYTNGISRVNINSTGALIIGANGASSATQGLWLFGDTSNLAQPRITSDGDDATVIRAGKASSYVKFNNFANSLELIRIEDDGDLVFHGAAAGRGIQWVNGGGTTLNYYKEGKWTFGSYSGCTADGTIVVRYVRVGHLVTLVFDADDSTGSIITHGTGAAGPCVVGNPPSEIFEGLGGQDVMFVGYAKTKANGVGMVRMYFGGTSFYLYEDLNGGYFDTSGTDWIDLQIQANIDTTVGHYTIPF